MQQIKTPSLLLKDRNLISTQKGVALDGVSLVSTYEIFML